MAKPRSRSPLPSGAYSPRGNPRLSFLEGVVKTGETLGRGSYGHVIEVKHKGDTCAAKIIHEQLLHPENQGRRDIIDKYLQECDIMESLQHPNVTKYLGQCRLQDSNLPVLVMERLMMSVDDILEYCFRIPLPVKLDILSDTCSGLAYLHGLQPQIVHRDLTARNVLLTSSLVAKITDLGNSRILQLQPGQQAQTLTQHPGTYVYMAPEALNKVHKYGPPLDIFSFGHLTLYVLTQIFPGKLLTSTYNDEVTKEEIVRNEIERRQAYIASLDDMYSHSHPDLCELVRQCFEFRAKKRPLAPDLLKRLCMKKIEIEQKYGGDMKKNIDTARVLRRKVNDKISEMKELNNINIQLEADNETLENGNKRRQSEKEGLQREIKDIEENVSNIAVAEAMHEKAALVQLLDSDNKKLQDEIVQLNEDKRTQHTIMNSLQEENDDLSGRLVLLEGESQRVQAGKQTIAEMKAKLYQLAYEKDELAEKIEEASNQSAQIKQIKEELEQKNQELKESNEKLADHKYNLKIVQDLASHRTDLSLQHELEEEDQLQALNGDLFAANIVLKNEHAAFSKTLRRLEEESRKQQIASDQMVTKGKEQEGFVKRLETENATSKSLLIQFKKETNEHKNTLIAIKNENLKLKSSLDKINAEHHAELDGLRKEVDSLQHRLHDKKKQLRDREKSVDKALQSIPSNADQPKMPAPPPPFHPIASKFANSSPLISRTQKMSSQKNTSAPLVHFQGSPSVQPKHAPAFPTSGEPITHHHRGLIETDYGRPKKKDRSQLQLYWNRTADMPIAMGTYSQAAVVGETIYVGGRADKSKQSSIIMAYNQKSSKWHLLPSCDTNLFSMTSVNKKLTLVGGSDACNPGILIKNIKTWQEYRKEWTSRSLPPLLTGRLSPSVTSYKNWLLVAGGSDGLRLLSSVEMLNVTTNQWSTAQSMPKLFSSIPSTSFYDIWYNIRERSTTVNDTWYIICEHYGQSCTISASLQSLVSFRKSTSIWRKIASLDCTNSCPIAGKHSLIALGGNGSDGNPLSTIQRYFPESKSWIHVGTLPQATYGCTSAFSGGKLYIIGGNSSSRTLVNVHYTEIDL